MERLFSPDYAWAWAIVLAVALFFPVRRLVWVLYVRRAERDGMQDDARRGALKRRAAFTSALLCLVFAFLYSFHLLQGAR